MTNRRNFISSLTRVAAGVALLASGLSAHAADTIKVGILHSLSGTMAISETSLKDVALMTIDEINAKGGVLGKKLEPVIVDRVQPFLRYQKFAADTGIDTRQGDVGVNYIIDGYNAQLAALYSRTTVTNVPNQSKFAVTLQLQY